MTTALLVVAGYLLGSMPWGYWLVRLLKHDDIYGYDPVMFYGEIYLPHVKQGMMLENDRAHVLRDAIMCCRSGGTVSVIGVYSGFIDKFPMGSVMNRSLTIRTGQCHVQRYMKPLLERIRKGEIDPSFVITHRMRLEDAPKGYEMFANKLDDCVKVVLSPN